MKLCAIYNVWDDSELLGHSVRNILPVVDHVIIVGSLESNSGEASSHSAFFWSPVGKITFEVCEPIKGAPAVENERRKRNFGLEKARSMGFTHFLMMDADEFYEPEAFLKEWERFKNPDLIGLVCRVKCYFRSPTLTIGFDVTLVPFIHKITPGLCFTWNTNYPFAWTATDGKPRTEKKQIRIDPTRQMNIASGVEWSEITMHHMSWIRPDIGKKIRNSTARMNIEKSTIVQDYVNAKPGYYCQFYGRTIESCENLFNFPEIIDQIVG